MQQYKIVMTLPTLADIRTAHVRIKPFIHRTPVMTSRLLNEHFNCELFFKCENFQKVGAFKFRGATNAVLSLSAEEKSRGVVTHSSGNHAAALALAARMNGVKANIVMPENAPVVKKNAVAGYGAEITFCKPTQQAREENTRMIIERTGATLVHPYDNFNVICGQGTAALELLEEVKNLDIVVAPVGGGGLLSGTSTCVKGINKNIRVVAAEPLNANDAYISFTTGTITPSVEIITAKEETIIECMLLVWERMKIIIEPSSATVLAIIKENRDRFSGKKIGLIISGGNVDFRKLPF